MGGKGSAAMADPATTPLPSTDMVVIFLIHVSQGFQVTMLFPLIVFMVTGENRGDLLVSLIRSSCSVEIFYFLRLSLLCVWESEPLGGSLKRPLDNMLVFPAERYDLENISMMWWWYL